MADTWCVPDPEAPRQTSKMSLQALCHRGWRRQLLTGFLVDSLRQHFSRPDGFLSELATGFQWQDQDGSPLLVEQSDHWKGSHDEHRPQLLIRPNEETTVRFLLGDRSADVPEGDFVYSVLWVGSHTVFALNTHVPSTEILAGEARTQLLSFSPVFRQYLHLQRFEVLGMGAPAALEESRRYFAIPINVGWAYIESWRLRTEELPLARINASIKTSIHCLGKEAR